VTLAHGRFLNVRFSQGTGIVSLPVRSNALPRKAIVSEAAGHESPTPADMPEFQSMGVLLRIEVDMDAAWSQPTEPEARVIAPH